MQVLSIDIDTNTTSDGSETYPFIIPGGRRFITNMTPEIRQNCSKLMGGDKEELERTNLLLNELDFKIHLNHSSCDAIMEEFSDNFYISPLEESFPIAYVLVVHTSAQQVIRFLKTIYRPHNHYCIHPDPTSKVLNFTERFKLLAKCLPNVFITSRILNVVYNQPNTILHAQMSCFRDLITMQPHLNWRYVVNLCGRELPLKTNRHIVEGLISLNGTNIIDPHPIDQYTLNTCFTPAVTRVQSNITCVGKSKSTRMSIATLEKCENFLNKNNFTLYKSMTYNAYSREFVHYFVDNPLMKSLRDWLMSNCRTPEEHFYAMASMMPEAPGGWLERARPLVSRAIWFHSKSSPHHVPGEVCHGKVVHSICILNSAELPRIHMEMTESNTWFLNKYYMELDHVVMDCMEEDLIKRNELEYKQDRSRILLGG